MLRARSVLPRRAFRFLSDLSEQSLRSLESMANSQPNDPHRQLMFMRALGKDHPKAVVERFQTGQYAESPEVVAEYIKALGQTGRLESMPETELRQLFSRAVGNASPSAAAAPEIAALTKLLSRNSAEAPLQVALAGDGARSQFWKTVRTLGGVFLLVTGIGAIMDSAAGGITGRNSMFNEVQPAPVTDKTFADIKGADEAKEELKEIVAFLKDPTKFTRLGGKLPKGVLLMGMRLDYLLLALHIYVSLQGHLEQGKRCLLELSLARQVFPSFTVPVPSSRRCLSVSGLVVSATCSRPPRSRRLALYSSTKSTPSVALVT